MTAVAGLRGSGDWGTDERPKNFREMINFRRPNGNAPIFGLLSRVQKESVDDPEFTWWDEPNDIIRLQVAGALGTTDTEVVVDSVDPSASSPGLVYGIATHLKPGDLLLVEPTADNATYDHEIIEVTAVASATSFSVRRGAAGTVAAAIGNDLFLTLVGSSYGEGTGAPQAASRNPIKYSNFTQIFKDVYEVTGTAAQTRARTGQLVANEKKRKSFDHSRNMEMALLWGVKSETTDANGKPLRTMDGLRKFVGNTTVFGSAVTVSSFLDAVTPVFDWESPAGDDRICFCGNTALNELNKVVLADTSTRITYQGTIKQFGLEFREFMLPQGRLLLRSHPLLNRHGLYKSSMYVIDFSSLRYRPLRNRDTKFMDNIQNKGEDLIRGQWMTEFGLEVAMGGLSNAYLGNISAT